MKITLNLRPLVLAGGLSVLALAGCTTVVRPGPAVVERPAPRPVVVEERVEYVRERPPPPRREARPYRPSPNADWVPGRWVWRNGWDWQPGHWENRPQPRARWQAGHWESRPSGWIWVEGGWR